VTPFVAVILVFAVVICGHRFRLAWKEQSTGWVLRAWVFGLISGGGLLVLAFVPLVQ
jgi:hypothetical protein